uniref:Uncharacterized protein n=1 Tax=Rhizophora mucronata TaxID=61149 RepID=A0A2P2QDL8_RHIMU
MEMFSPILKLKTNLKLGKQTSSINPSQYDSRKTQNPNKQKTWAATNSSRHFPKSQAH